MFKSIKKVHKWGILCVGPRGCDVARKATLLCHVDTRACLRGTDVTRGRIIYIYYIVFNNMYIGLLIIGRQIVNHIIWRTLYTRSFH